MINDTQIPIDEDSPLALQPTWVELVVGGGAATRKTVILSEPERQKLNIIRQTNTGLAVYVTESFGVRSNVNEVIQKVETLGADGPLVSRGVTTPPRND